MSAPLLSPLFAPAPLLARMPPTLLVVGDAETMLDDSTPPTHSGTAFARRAAAAGARSVVCIVYRRMWHVWPMYSDGCGVGTPLRAGRDAIRRIAQFCNSSNTKAPPPPHGAHGAMATHTTFQQSQQSQQLQ
eukprot:gene20471-38840_t